jgi:hypothetical protein
VLDSLFVTPAVAPIVEALGSARADGKLAVIGNAKLAAALVAKKREIIAIGLSSRAAKKLTNALADLSSIEARSLHGVIGSDIAIDDGWEITLAHWREVVRDGGVLVFVDRGHAAEASRRALCAGLTEIEQRHVGRTIVTSGLVTHLR